MYVITLNIKLIGCQQIENEYGNIENAFGQRGKDYVKWAAKMATGLGAGVPWVMCRQTDAPENIVKFFLTFRSTFLMKLDMFMI